MSVSALQLLYLLMLTYKGLVRSMRAWCTRHQCMSLPATLYPYNWLPGSGDSDILKPPSENERTIARFRESIRSPQAMRDLRGPALLHGCVLDHQCIRCFKRGITSWRAVRWGSFPASGAKSSRACRGGAFTSCLAFPSFTFALPILSLPSSLGSE